MNTKKNISIERNCKTHGVHSNWKLKKRPKKGWQYTCRFCLLEKRRNKRILSNYKKLFDTVGKDIADDYLNCANSGQRVHISHFLAKARRKKVGLPVNIHRYAFARIAFLNLAAKKPIENVGWNCAICGVFSKEQTFFEVDRLLPGKDGGTYDVENIRLLCPNCHRCVTFNMESWVCGFNFKDSLS